MTTGTMAVADHKVDAKNGVWVTAGPSVQFDAHRGVRFGRNGPGLLSVDGLLRKQRSRLSWALVDPVLGLGGATATLALANKLAPGEGAATVCAG
jgi:hypothetical protein